MTGGELGTGGGRKFRVRKINFHHKLQEDDCQQSAKKGIVTIANPTHKDIFLEPFYSLLEKPGQCIANPMQNDIDLTKPNMLTLKKGHL